MKTRALILPAIKRLLNIEENGPELHRSIQDVCFDQLNSLLDFEKEHTKLVYLRNEEDKRRGVEFAMNKLLGFYKECLELGPEYVTGMDDKGKVTKAHLLEDKQIPSVGVFSTWMAFGGNTRDLGSFGEETDKITDLHQIHEEVLFTERGDGVAGIKRRRRDLSSDGVRDLATASGQVFRITTDQQYGLDYMEQILVMRENDNPNSFSEADFKYLNKNYIEDLYYLCRNKKVNYRETKLMNSLLTSEFM
ncbi:hypothetical protein Tco_1387067 [Tanacetum coccineum]